MTILLWCHLYLEHGQSVFCSWGFVENSPCVKQHCKWFDIRPHRRHTRTVHSDSPGGANVQPYIESQKMVAVATSLSCRVSAISAFCLPTTQTPSITNSPVAIVCTMPVIAILVPKLVAKLATSLSTSEPPSNTRFLGPIRAHNPNGISIGSTVFAQMTVEYPYTLQWDARSPSQKKPLPMGGFGPPSNTWFPRPTQVLNTNGISIGSAVFAGLTSVTERQTTLLGR